MIAALVLLAGACRDVLGVHPATSRLPPTVSDAGAPDAMPAAGSGGGAGEVAGAAPVANGGAGGERATGGVGGVAAAGSGGAGMPAAGSGGAGGRAAAGAGGAGGREGTIEPTGTPVTPSCAEGQSRCRTGSELEVCRVTDGQASWQSGASCGPHQRCMATGSSAQCTCLAAPSGCEPGAGSFCQDGALETCLADADGCVYRGEPVACPADKPCSGEHPNASCSCAAAPAECQGLTGAVCRSAQERIRCARNASGCLTVANSETCPAPTTCAGTPGAATCKCPSAPAACMGVGTGDVCVSDTAYVHCTTDANGCVSASGLNCAAGKPCRGAPGSASCTCIDEPSPTQCPADARAGARCVGSSLYQCGSDALGCLRFKQQACATGICGGSYPSAQCVSEHSSGWPNDLGGMQQHVTGALAGTRVGVPAASTLRRFGVISRQAGTHIILALYDELNGQPHNRVAATANTALVAGTNEIAVSLPPNAPVLPAGNYWIMVSVDAATQLAHGSASVPLAYVSYTHGGVLPSTLSVVSSDVMTEPNLYIVVLPQ
jgi:hypothetical protein